MNRVFIIAKVWKTFLGMSRYIAFGRWVDKQTMCECVYAAPQWGGGGGGCVIDTSKMGRETGVRTSMGR